MTPNPKALEAAARAICENTNHWERSLEDATAAITAYFASLKEQGMMREAFCYEEYNDERQPSWNADTHFVNGDGKAFRVFIIRTNSNG